MYEDRGHELKLISFGQLMQKKEERWTKNCMSLDSISMFEQKKKFWKWVLHAMTRRQLEHWCKWAAEVAVGMQRLQTSHRIQSVAATAASTTTTTTTTTTTSTTTTTTTSSSTV